MPVGSIRPFWLPPTVTSMPQASILYSIDASEEMVSESSSAGCLVSSSARRISASGSTMPVAVSLWTDEHGLDLVRLVLGQPLGELGDVGALAPVGGDGLDLEAEVGRHLRPAQREVAGLDDQHACRRPRTGWRAPLPRRRGRSSVVHVERPGRSSAPASRRHGRHDGWPRNSSDMKSITGRSMARRTRSGMLVGPGLLKNWRPRGLAFTWAVNGGSGLRKSGGP